MSLFLFKSYLGVVLSSAQIENKNKPAQMVNALANCQSERHGQ